VIVIDSSALVAIVYDESEADAFSVAIVNAENAWMSAATWLESAIVVERARGPAGRMRLDKIVAALEIEIVPFDAIQAAVACDAFLRFGKGRHKAGLNFGDCMSYALAKTRNAKLLCKGADFAATDATLV
jgi:ribonuclease VapC